MRHIQIHMKPNEKRTFNIIGKGFSVNNINPFVAKIYYLVDNNPSTANQLIGRNIKFTKRFKTFTIVNTEETAVTVDFYVLETEEDFQSLADPSILGLGEVNTNQIKTWQEEKTFSGKNFICRQIANSTYQHILIYNQNKKSLVYDKDIEPDDVYINEISIINNDTTNTITARLYTVDFNSGNPPSLPAGTYAMDKIIYPNNYFKYTNKFYTPIITPGNFTGKVLFKNTYFDVFIKPQETFRISKVFNLPLILKTEGKLLLSFSNTVTNFAQVIIDFSLK